MAHKRPDFKQLYPKIGQWFASSSLPEILLIATLCMSRYLQNSDFSYPSEIMLTIVLFGILATAVYYLYRLILRNRFAAHTASLLLMYGLYGFSYAYPRLHHLGDVLVPNSLTAFEQAMLQALWLALVFGLIGWGANKLRSIKQLHTIPALKFLLFVICFIFAAEVGKMGLRMWDIRRDLTYKAPASSLGQPAQTTHSTTGKPNVYYLLFDRYASDTTLKNSYGYDNSPLLNNLTDQGFVVRSNAFANYPFTMQSVSSTLSAGYHTDIGKLFKNDSPSFQTGFAYRTILDNSPVTQAFQANGYNYNQVSSWWDFTRLNPSADSNPAKSFRLRAFGKNFWLSDLQRDIVNKSILSPLLLKGLVIGHTSVVDYQLDRNPTQNFYAEMHAIKRIAANSAHQSKPQFTFAHILSPHDPYIFDAQGNNPTYDGNRTDNGIDEALKYTNQLSYLNTQITDLVSTIRTKDPSAAIVIQADEGPYPKQFRGTLTKNNYYDPINLPITQQRQKFGVLAAYYMPDTDSQVVADNMTASVNTFRFVLNRYLGYKLDLLPDCQFTVGDKFKLYNYQLVTGQLKGTANPQACYKYR